MVFRMSLKAQSALEFLTTYGWAFLVILIMIGTLAYFGVLSPSKIVPNRCTFGSEFQCLDYQISATANTFKVRLKNNVGEPITVSTISLGSEGTTGFTCTPSNPTYPYSSWKSGNISEFTWTGCNAANAGFVQGEKGKVFVTVNYYSVASGSGYTKETKGEVLSTII